MKPTLRGVLGLTLTLGLLVTTTGAFGGSDYTIYPLHDDHVVLDVSNGWTASILLVWDAKTKGQVGMFIDSEETGYSLRDDTTGTVIWQLTPTEAGLYWSSPYPTTDTFGLECKKDYFWEALFSAPLPDLEAGHHYTLTVEFFNRHPVNDGLHMCGFEHFNFPVIGWTSVITIDAV